MRTDLESPISRIMSTGWSGAAATDLLTLALSQSEADLLDAEIRARDLLRQLGSLQALADLSREQIKSNTGLDDFEVYRAMAWLELGRKSATASKGPQNFMMEPADVAHLLKHLNREKKEHFVVLLLDVKNALMKWSTIHIGTLSMSVVGAREVFREAIREGASSMIVAHNHPSGDCEPSPEDIAITLKLDEVGKLLDIKVWDHIILGAGNWVSLRQRGIFDLQPSVRNASKAVTEGGT